MSARPWSDGGCRADNVGMAAEPEVAPPRARRRPRRRWRLLFAALLVLWLAGRGLGLIGDASTAAEPVGEPAGEPKAEAKVDPEATAAQPAPGPEAAGTTALAGRQTPAPLDPAAEVVSAAPQPPGGAAPGPAGIDNDRFASLLSLVDLRLAQGEVGRALAVLAELTPERLSAQQRDEVRQRRQLAEQALGTSTAEVRAWLRSGDVRLATAAVRALAAGGAATAALLAELPCGAAPDRPAPDNDGSWRQPEPLAKGRAVRLLVGGTRRVGTVVDSRSDRVTLRVATGQGVTFPTVELGAVEPLDPTADEAVAMAWAALHAGDPLAARLWLACAELRAGDQPPAGVAELARLIR